MFKRITQTGAVRGLGACASFASILFLANFYGAESLGVYQYTMTFFVGVAMVCRFGMNRVSLRELAAADAPRALAGNHLLVSLLLALVLVFAIYIGCRVFIFFSDGRAALEALSHYVFIAVPACLLAVCVAYFKAKSRAPLAAFFEAVAWQALLLLFWIFTAFNDIELSAQLVAGAIFVGWTVAFVSAFGLSRIRQFDLRALGADARRIYRAGLPCVTIDLLNYARTSAVILFLAAFADSKSVGLFAVALRLMHGFGLAAYAIHSVASPQVAAAFAANNIRNLRRAAKIAANYRVLLMLPLLAILLWFDDFILRLFGAEFVAAAEFVKVLLIGHTFNMLCGPAPMVLEMNNKAEALRTATFAGALVALGLAFLLIPSHAALGAAIAVAAGASVTHVSALIFVRRQLGFWCIAGVRGLRSAP